MTEPTLHDTQAGFAPNEGQAFYFTSKPPAKPAPRKGWLLPLLGSIILLPLLMLGFGLSQQQTPPTAATPSPPPSTTPAPAESPSSIPGPAPSPEATAQPQTTERLVPAAASVALPDQPALAVVAVRCPGVIANFRSAPSLHSLVQDVMPDGALIETTNRRVAQDGVIWQEVRYRGQMGWVASNFVGGQTNANL